MVRVVRFREVGGPEVLTIGDENVRDPGPAEVRLRVEALGLNRAEAVFRAGRYLEAPVLPARLGYEAAGTIDAVGPGVAGLRPGQRAAVIPAFSLNEHGTYGELAVVPAAAVVPIPAGQSAVDAAATWMQYLTAYGALIDLANVAAGDHVVITAASSSVGLAAIQVAKRAGAVPIAVTRTAAKREALRTAGAPHVIVSDDEDIVGAVKTITGGKGARVIFDPIAGPGVKSLANAAARGGILILYGNLNPEPTPFPLFRALGFGLSVRGYTLFEVTNDPARLARGKAYVLDGLASGAFRPVIARTFPLDQIVEAHRYLESNQQIGKIVVTV